MTNGYLRILRRSTFLLTLAAALSACGGSPGDGAPMASTTSASHGAKPAPAISGITPSSGWVSGGAAVTITGTGFMNGTTVTIGGTAAFISSVTASSIMVTSPAGTAGPADVTVRNPDGQFQTLVGGFTYAVPAGPVVSALSVRGSPQAGGGLLLISGMGLDSVVSLTFGGAPATALSYNPLPGVLVVTIPASPLGPTVDDFVDLVLTNSNGQSTTWPGFHYGNPPVATGFTPGFASKGSTVVISGHDFSAGATGPRAGLQVFIGGAPATITQMSATQISVTVPSLHTGVYPVIVTNFDGQYSVAPGTLSVSG